MIYKKLKKTKEEKIQDRLISEWKKKVRKLNRIENPPEPVIKSILSQDEKLNKFAKRIKGKSYKRFLKSAYWKMVRKLVLIRDGYKCTVCLTDKKLHVHHKTYKHHFSEHLYLEDMCVLCKKHHKEIHKDDKKITINETKSKN